MPGPGKLGGVFGDAPKPQASRQSCCGYQKVFSISKTFFPCAEFWGGGKVAWPRHLANLNRKQARPLHARTPVFLCVYVRTRRKEDRRAARKDKAGAELATVREQCTDGQRGRAGTRLPQCPTMCEQWEAGRLRRSCRTSGGPTRRMRPTAVLARKAHRNL